MSLIYVPPGHLQLASACSLRMRVDRPCEEEEQVIQFVCSSDTARYVSYLQSSSRATGGCDTYTPPGGVSIGTGLITCNNIFYYANNTGTPLVISSITLTANGEVGTKSGVSNTVGIGAGSGMICAWEMSDIGAAAFIQAPYIEFAKGTASYGFSTVAPIESTTLALTTGRWLSPYECPFTPQTPVQTPINKTWTFTNPITLGATGGTRNLRIKFLGGGSESVTIIVAPVTVTLHLL